MTSCRRILRPLYVALCLLPAAALAPCAPARAEVFLSVLDDVPVMPGMSELAGEAVAFDSPGGRIVSAAIVGPEEAGPDAGSVIAFYGATLPALGWRAGSRTRFLRDGEVLSLALSRWQGRIRLDFEVRPQ